MPAHESWKAAHGKVKIKDKTGPKGEATSRDGTLKQVRRPGRPTKGVPEQLSNGGRTGSTVG